MERIRAQRPPPLLAGLLTVLFLAIAVPSIAGLICNLSWWRCSPRQRDESWAGQKTYNLVVPLQGYSGRIVGWDLSLELFRGRPYYTDYCWRDDPHFCDYPDAWRFEDGGCQGPSRVIFSGDSSDASCRNLRGGHPLQISNVTFGDPERLQLRYATTFDTVSVDSTNTYSLVTIGFNHEHSLNGPTAPGFCAGAGRGFIFRPVAFYLLTAAGQAVQVPTDVVSWASWVDMDPIPTESATWGRLKGLYR